ncbi:hypothetical protein Tco_1161190, partial [Tanacetum coccineum]
LQKKSLAYQFIFQKRPPIPTESSTHAESPSMDVELNLIDSETESDEEASKINVGNQEGQAGPNPGEQDEGQARPNPGTSYASTKQKPEQMDEEFTATAYPNVKENLKLPTEDQVILKELACSTGTLSSLQNLDKDLSFTDQFFMEKPHEEESGKTNAKTEVQSMVSVPIHRILSVVRIKAYSRYGYDYLSKIILRRADHQEHTIAEKDFKNMYPNDFKDLNLLLLQGHLDHLSCSDKRMLSTAIKLWTRNLVIRQRVKDFQLGIKSYQTQLNLTKPGWEATGYEFKHDYTIIESPRAIVFPVNNNE